MWDPAIRRTRVFETANLVVEALRREFPRESPIIRRPDRNDLERLEVAVPRKVAWTVRFSVCVKERVEVARPVGVIRRVVEVRNTADLRWRLRVERTRAHLTTPQRQCLWPSALTLRINHDKPRKVAKRARRAGRKPPRPLSTYARRRLLVHVIRRCRCLGDDAVIALVRWADSWRPPDDGAGEESSLFICSGSCGSRLSARRLVTRTCDPPSHCAGDVAGSTLGWRRS